MPLRQKAERSKRNGFACLFGNDCVPDITVGLCSGNNLVACCNEVCVRTFSLAVCRIEVYERTALDRDLCRAVCTVGVIAVQNELVKAINELRDEFARKNWGKGFDQLEEDQQRIAKDAIPQFISEAEPKDVARRR